MLTHGIPNFFKLEKSIADRRIELMEPEGIIFCCNANVGFNASADDLCLLAMGFLGPEKNGLLDQIGLQLDARGKIVVNEDSETSVPGVYAAGEARRGQSLVISAISESRSAAPRIDAALLGRTNLPYMKLV